MGESNRITRRRAIANIGAVGIAALGGQAALGAQGFVAEVARDLYGFATLFLNKSDYFIGVWQNNLLQHRRLHAHTLSLLLVPFPNRRQ